MNKVITLVGALVLLGAISASAQMKIGGKTLSKKTTNIIGASADAIKAVTLSDEEVAALCRESVDWMDANNQIADETTEWGARLKKLTAGITHADGIPVNFKVYYVSDINAFAAGDGSIRVFSSLMDIMNDEELMAIIGHELGHIVNTDVKDAFKTAYLASAARQGASAAGGKVGKLSDSEWGDMINSFTNAQFSQSQENAADDYGYAFAIKHGYSPYAMARSLDRLVEISNGANASKIQRMFQSHPDSQKRAERMKEKADNYK